MSFSAFSNYTLFGKYFALLKQYLNILKNTTNLNYIMFIYWSYLVLKNSPLKFVIKNSGKVNNLLSLHRTTVVG